MPFHGAHGRNAPLSRTASAPLKISYHEENASRTWLALPMAQYGSPDSAEGVKEFSES